MSEVDREREFWDAKAQDELIGREAIAADPSAWEGAALEASLEQIVPVIAPLPHHWVLDIGCGLGRLTLPLAERFPRTRLVGVDISPRYVARAREAARARGLDVDFCVGDGRTLPLQSGCFDSAFSMITFQHIPQDGQAAYIAEVGRVLMEGGVFRFQVLESAGAGSAAFMWHEVSVSFLEEACAAAELEIEALDRLAPLNTSDQVTVLWVTARRR